MRKCKKMGFTIVELVIVIAVIAVLAAVLIPTFFDIIDKAQESALLQEIANAYKEALAKAYVNNGKIDGNTMIELENGFVFCFSDSSGLNARVILPEVFEYTAAIQNGKVILNKKDDNQSDETPYGTYTFRNGFKVTVFLTNAEPVHGMIGIIADDSEYFQAMIQNKDGYKIVDGSISVMMGDKDVTNDVLNSSNNFLYIFFNADFVTDHVIVRVVAVDN